MKWLVVILSIPYIYLLLKIYYSLFKIKPYKSDLPSDLLVSVIVACRNEQKNLPSLLSFLSAQNYDADKFEVIIIDDNSADSTFNIASEFSGIRNLIAIRNPGNGKKSAIKTGVDACKGELVITTDADCTMRSRWITTIASYYSEYKPEMIICPVTLKGGKGFFRRFQELEFLSLQGITAGTAMQGNPVMCNGANLAFTKKAFKNNSINLHAEKMSGDDVFLLHSLKQNKSSRILWLESNDALVKTCSSETWSSFIDQRARWISKAGSYSDTFTILLAIVTFVTILLLPLLLITCIFNQAFLPVFLAAFLLKSIPDYLILHNTAVRYKRKELLRWFIPSQIFYTYYILRIVPKAIYKGNHW